MDLTLTVQYRYTVQYRGFEWGSFSQYLKFKQTAQKIDTGSLTLWTSSIKNYTKATHTLPCPHILE